MKNPQFISSSVHQFIKTRFKLVKLLLITLTLLSSCKKEFEILETKEAAIFEKKPEYNYRDGEIELGKKLENPYSV
jgi:hypothetical protein